MKCTRIRGKDCKITEEDEDKGRQQVGYRGHGSSLGPVASYEYDVVDERVQEDVRVA